MDLYALPTPLRGPYQPPPPRGPYQPPSFPPARPNHDCLNDCLRYYLMQLNRKEEITAKTLAHLTCAYNQLCGAGAELQDDISTQGKQVRSLRAVLDHIEQMCQKTQDDIQHIYQKTQDDIQHIYQKIQDDMKRLTEALVGQENNSATSLHRLEVAQIEKLDRLGENDKAIQSRLDEIIAQLKQNESLGVPGIGPDETGRRRSARLKVQAKSGRKS